MTLLSVAYTSAPTSEVIIPSLEIRVPGLESLYLCNGFEDFWLVVNGTPRLHESGPLTVGLPAKNTTGNQTIKFGFAGVTGRAQQYVDVALAAGEPSYMILREYLHSDITAPSGPEYMMTIIGGGFEGAMAVFEGSYYDLLNAAWPRERYTAENAPGIMYL